MNSPTPTIAVSSTVEEVKKVIASANSSDTFEIAKSIADKIEKSSSK